MCSLVGSALHVCVGLGPAHGQPSAKDSRDQGSQTCSLRPPLTCRCASFAQHGLFFFNLDLNALRDPCILHFPAGHHSPNMDHFGPWKHLSLSFLVWRSKHITCEDSDSYGSCVRGREVGPMRTSAVSRSHSLRPCLQGPSEPTHPDFYTNSHRCEIKNKWSKHLLEMEMCPARSWKIIFVMDWVDWGCIGHAGLMSNSKAQWRKQKMVVTHAFSLTLDRQGSLVHVIVILTWDPSWLLLAGAIAGYYGREKGNLWRVSYQQLNGLPQQWRDTCVHSSLARTSHLAPADCREASKS